MFGTFFFLPDLFLLRKCLPEVSREQQTLEDFDELDLLKIRPSIRKLPVKAFFY